MAPRAVQNDITQASVIDQILAHRRTREVRLPDTRPTPIEFPVPGCMTGVPSSRVGTPTLDTAS